MDVFFRRRDAAESGETNECKSGKQCFHKKYLR
jgi:hypothetical protein